jgi:predicted nucleic acid-binding protein
MDVCSLNRPFDDLSQDRVYLEAEAILAIISRCENNEWVLLSSGVIDFELSQLQDKERLERVQTIYGAAKERLLLSQNVEQRAKYFRQLGMKVFDSLHLALAETYRADVFLSTDDRLLRTANKTDLSINAVNPVSWLMEVIK